MNTISTLQIYGKETPGFHHGLDMRASAGTKVFAPIGGKVGHGYYYPKRKMPYTYMVSIDGDDGFRWEFHHIDELTIPQRLRDLAASGGRVERGEFLADIYDATTVGIDPHVHVDIIDKSGVHHNPLGFFPALDDRQAPKIRGIYFVDATSWALKADRLMLLESVDYDLVVDVADSISSQTHGDSLYGLDLLINGAVVSSIRFDQLPAASYLEGVRETYRIAPFVWGGRDAISNQIETDKPRNFLFHFPFKASVYPDEARLAVEIIAHDYAGNSTSEKFFAEIHY